MIRVLVADDHPLVREGLRRIIESCDDMLLAGEAATGEEALALMRLHPSVDVLVLDITMPGPGFVEVLRRVRANRPHTRVVVLSMHPEESFAIRALRAGAAAYLTKERSAAELALAIRRVHGGGRYISESLAELLATQVNGHQAANGESALSEREYQVLCLLAKGNSIRDIGAQLALSPKTVSTYRFRIMAKMNFRSIADLVRYALENRLID